MELELVRGQAAGAKRGTALLVHGICSGAWIWPDAFKDVLHDAGFETLALSLRGHGRSEGHEDLRRYRLHDYVDDLFQAARGLDGPLHLVGHSLGGAVVQGYVQRGGRADGAVLMASVPPYGLAGASANMALRHPVLWLELVKALAQGVATANPTALRRGLFNGRVDDATFAWFLRNGQDESPLIAWDLAGFPPLGAWPCAMPPTLVVAGRDDPFIPLADARATALYYHARLAEFDHVGHVQMLDPEAPAIAGTVAGFLSGLTARAAAA